VLDLFGHGLFHMGALVIVLFETYLHPAEALAMGPAQVVLPRAGAAGAARWMTVVVYPEEELTLSKVRECDHSDPLDLERQQFLVPAVERLVAVRRGEQGSWHVEYEQLRIEFAKAISRLGLRGLGFSLCGLRNGGSSHDRSVTSRELAAGQQRGCWRS
jgi:hypothetical protein